MRHVSVMIGVTVMIMAMAGIASCGVSSADDAIPTIQMDVGDTFIYETSTNLDSDYTASGTGLIDDVTSTDGAFLTFDSETVTLSGTAVAPGTWTVTIVAVWTSPSGGLTQTTQQMITFNVTNADSEATTYHLVYDDEVDAWEVLTDSDEQSNNDMVLTVSAAAILIMIAILIGVKIL